MNVFPLPMTTKISLLYNPDASTFAVELPLSKSVALRVMTLNAVAQTLTGRQAEIPVLPDSGDVKGLKDALKTYLELLPDGARSTSDDAAYKTSVSSPHIINIGEGGAPFRFFTALAASTPGLDITLTTRRPLMKRPHAMLLKALREAGAEIKSIRRPDMPPLRICGRQLSANTLIMNAGVSSQYLSALMMAAPLWNSGVTLRFDEGRIVSFPYLRVTQRVMERFGCRIELRMNPDERLIRVAPQECLAPSEFEIPTDWSAASYFYELALLLPQVGIRLKRLSELEESLQGDAFCEAIFARLGVSTIRLPDGGAVIRNAGREPDEATLFIDLNGTPDLAPALAVGFCLSGRRFRFESVSHLRHKETDRIAALTCELRKLGFIVRSSADSMGWDGERCEALSAPLISTYSDHRIAMAFAMAAVKFPGLTIENPGVVEKSFPHFWENLACLGFEINHRPQK